MDNTQINQILSLFWKQALAVIDSKYMSVAKSKSIIKTEANKVVPTLIDDRLPEVVGEELDKYALNSTLNNEIAKINDNITAVLAAHTADVNDVKDMIANLDLGVRYVVTDSMDGIEVKPGTIYLVPKGGDEANNFYTEYLAYNKADGSVAIDKIGDTEVKLDGFATYEGNKLSWGSNSIWIG